jgi:acetolactate synthase-1/2/3 large subunit
MTIKADLPIIADAKDFISGMIDQNNRFKLPNIDSWKAKCSGYKRYNRIPTEWKEKKEYVDPYVLVDHVSDLLNNNDLIVVDGGGAVVYTSFQAFKVKKGQRLIISSGLCAMGSGLPESIGACFASGKKRTICFVGDGSMQLNIQELQTIVHHKLPVKIFVFNNEGYLAIRHTQNGFLNRSYVGSDRSGGLSLPDFIKVAESYGIRAMKISDHHEMYAKVANALEHQGPVLCEMMVSREQEVVPRQGFYPKGDGSSAAMPLEDMEPYLDRKEFMDNMIVKPWEVNNGGN